MAVVLRSLTWLRPLRTLPCNNTRIHGIRCFSAKEPQTPQLLKLAVSGVTEFLRVLSSTDRNSFLDKEWMNEVSVSNVDDVLAIIKGDYEKAHFVTGFFTSAIYAEDCTFKDPTIKFQGTELYARSLSLLVPFFDNPSIKLREIEKVLDSEAVNIYSCFMETKLDFTCRTYLKLPWKPLISIEGRTVYDLDEELRIVRHVESWTISALEAIIQIFTPSSGKSNQ